MHILREGSKLKATTVLLILIPCIDIFNTLRLPGSDLIEKEIVSSYEKWSARPTAMWRCVSKPTAQQLCVPQTSCGKRIRQLEIYNWSLGSFKVHLRLRRYDYCEVELM